MIGKKTLQSIIIGIMSVLLVLLIMVIILLYTRNKELEKVAYMTTTTSTEQSEKTGDRQFIPEIDNADNASESLYSYVQPEIGNPIKDTISTYINTYYNYNQSNFIQRLVDVKPCCTDKMYSSMTDGMDLSKEVDFPNEIQSTVLDEITVLSTVEPTEATAYVAVRAFNKIADIEQTSQIILEVHLALEDTWKISKIVVLGSGE